MVNLSYQCTKLDEQCDSVLIIHVFIYLSKYHQFSWTLSILMRISWTLSILIKNFGINSRMNMNNT